MDCLQSHMKEEEVEDWYCSNCKKLTKGRKKLDLWKLPDTLVIHIKRFFQHPRYQIWLKRDVNVEYPIKNLDLSELVLERGENRYVLVAISNHLGNMSCGHCKCTIF
jgi:ubiquitin carboxyl-terminal hydrolase 4/11/15